LKFGEGEYASRVRNPEFQTQGFSEEAVEGIDYVKGEKPIMTKEGVSTGIIAEFKQNIVTARQNNPKDSQAYAFNDTLGAFLEQAFGKDYQKNPNLDALLSPQKAKGKSLWGSLSRAALSKEGKPERQPKDVLTKELQTRAKYSGGIIPTEEFKQIYERRKVEAQKMSEEKQTETQAREISQQIKDMIESGVYGRTITEPAVELSAVQDITGLDKILASTMLEASESATPRMAAVDAKKFALEFLKRYNQAFGTNLRVSPSWWEQQISQFKNE